MNTLVEVLYLAASVLFIAGIKLLTRVKTARRGNLLSSLGMLIAILATLYLAAGSGKKPDWGLIAAGVAVGSAIGVFSALKVKMTAMPQMVAAFNGLGGGASAIVALVSFLYDKTVLSSPERSGIALASMAIGSLTFSGSFIAFGKLQGIVSPMPIKFRFQHLLNLLLLIAIVVLGTGAASSYLMLGPSSAVFIAASLILGILLVIPIGGADMPVVIALLNAYSGLAASAAGFVLNNTLLVISGALVGASGLILTAIMCRAMNRSLTNVLFGGLGGEPTAKGKEEGYASVKECSSEEAALLFESAQKAVIVPGYGMAVAQAQHAVRDLAQALEDKGIRVLFAIHPVAGRMPGHMNVLLAEADIPYDKLKDLDEANREFKNADIALVVGANDVVNPAASRDKGSPIYGMPVLNVNEAKTVIVVKRSLSPGFAGVKNELFEADNTLMLFGDAKEKISEIVKELNEI